jgi:S-adenosylmethionine decarboxylase
MRVEWFSYTRKDFLFPTEQKFPHRGASEEIAYLKELFPEGSAFLMGPVTADHWFMYIADYVDRPTSECVDRTLDMMMFGIDEDVRFL